MNNMDIYKKEENILLKESFDGFLKIFINLSIASISTKFAILAFAEGNKITAFCYSVVAALLLVLSAGYLLINIVGKASISFEIKAAKCVGDEKSVSTAQIKLLLSQIVLGLVALIIVGSIYVVGAWIVAEFVVSRIV